MFPQPLAVVGNNLQRIHSLNLGNISSMNIILQPFILFKKNESHWMRFPFISIHTIIATVVVVAIAMKTVKIKGGFSRFIDQKT